MPTRQKRMPAYLVLSCLFVLFLSSCNSSKYETAKEVKYSGTNSYGYYENYEYKDLKATRFYFGIEKMNYQFKYFNGNNVIAVFQIEQPTKYKMNFLTNIKSGKVRFSIVNTVDTFMSVVLVNGKETSGTFTLPKPGMYFLLTNGVNASGKYSINWSSKLGARR